MIDMRTLKAGTHYIASGDNGLEISFVLNDRGPADNSKGILSGFIVNDGKVTDQAIAVRAIGSATEEIWNRFGLEAAISFESLRGFGDQYGHITEPLFIGDCFIAPESTVSVFIRKYVPGTSLEQFLRENGPLPEGKALSFLAQIAQALTVAHSNNVIHKCLKPSNIIVSKDEETVFVSDFGTGCFLSREALTNLTIDDELIHYLSPEQIKGTVGIDGATDVFSLGSLLFKMVTGSDLFQGSSVSRIFAAITKRTADIEHSGISSYTKSLISKMVERERTKRFISASKVLADLPPTICPGTLTRFVEGGGIRCFQCGEYNAANSHFCIACGRDFSSRCSGCKSLIFISENFCRACGNSITRASSKAYLIGLRGGFSGTRIELGTKPIHFGRHKDNDVSFAGVDKYVSRFQSRITSIRNQFWIESGYAAGGKTTNGTFVNGRNIDGVGFVLLKRGDKVRMGDSFFRFVY